MMMYVALLFSNVIDKLHKLNPAVTLVALARRAASLSTAGALASLLALGIALRESLRQLQAAVAVVALACRAAGLSTAGALAGLLALGIALRETAFLHQHDCPHAVATSAGRAAALLATDAGVVVHTLGDRFTHVEAVQVAERNGGRCAQERQEN
jgi:hypothetical protein